MRRKILAIAMIISVLLTVMPAAVYAASLPGIDDKSVCYTPYSDYNSGDCVLTSCKTMLRRYAISRGSQKWSTITNKALRPYAAPTGGLKFEFDYTNDGLRYHVKHGYFQGNTEASKKAELAELLKSHKEGIIVWGPNCIKSGPHAVLVVKVENGVVYAIDSSYNRGYKSGSYNYGVQKWANTTMLAFNRITKYWCLNSASGKSTSASDKNIESSLAINSVTSPAILKKGASFTLRGIIDSNYLISNVTVEVLDSKGKAVITQSAKPGSWIYDIHDYMDYQIKFGTLPVGVYTYRITATDEKKTEVLHESTFKVTKSGKDEVITEEPDTGNETGTGDDGKTDEPTDGTDAGDTATVTSKLAISGQTLPGDMKQGSSFTIKGKVTSDATIKSVRIAIADASGTEILSVKSTPNAKSYDISRLDTSVKFGKLAAGSYVYKVIAADEKQELTLAEKAFSVTGPSTLKMASASAPKSLSKGQSFSVKGKITSNSTIKSVKISITDSKGNETVTASASPKAKSYDLAKLDPDVKFGGLGNGTYVYRVTAADEKQTITLVEQQFTVSTPSTLKVTSASKPGDIARGSGFSIKGTVKSNYKITKVQILITTKAGKTKLSASAKPNKKSYSLQNLDARVKFGKLEKGTYIYKVIAKDSKQEKTLVKKTFKVK